VEHFGLDGNLVVSTSADKDAVFVTEIWRTEADHDASLRIAGVSDLIKRARPLIAGTAESTRLAVRGDKGLIARW
jgi:quinol monooxygenase YgiN